MRRSLPLFAATVLLYVMPFSAAAKDDNQNEQIAAKATLAEAISHHSQVTARYSAGAVTDDEVGKAALRVEQAKLKLAVLGRDGGDVVARMKRIISIEQDQEKLIQTRFAAGAVTELDLKDAQIELAEQQIQMERANVANLRQQQFGMAQQHAKAGAIIEGDLTGYRSRAERAWQELKSHIPE
jgi:hypothetical protein